MKVRKLYYKSLQQLQEVRKATEVLPLHREMLAQLLCLQPGQCREQGAFIGLLLLQGTLLMGTQLCNSATQRTLKEEGALLSILETL